jgi:hypothetical protein
MDGQPQCREETFSNVVCSRGNLLLIHAGSGCAMFAMYRAGDSPEVGI